MAVLLANIWEEDPKRANEETKVPRIAPPREHTNSPPLLGIHPTGGAPDYPALGQLRLT